MSEQPMWVFGYGSLMWNPGFPVAERHVARLEGWHRSFCMRSFHYRGTEAAPGLVLALDAAEGANCLGLAFRVSRGAEAVTLEYLRERELISDAYLEARVPVILADQHQIEAVTYVINRDNIQYCGGLPLPDQAKIIARARGQNGPNTEYLFNTVEHLEKLGIDDAELSWLTRKVREINTSGQR